MAIPKRYALQAYAILIIKICDRIKLQNQQNRIHEWLKTYFKSFSCVSVVELEQVDVCCEISCTSLN